MQRLRSMTPHDMLDSFSHVSDSHRHTYNVESFVNTPVALADTCCLHMCLIEPQTRSLYDSF